MFFYAQILVKIRVNEIERSNGKEDAIVFMTSHKLRIRNVDIFTSMLSGAHYASEKICTETYREEK